ncbi:MAG: aminotransferase class V-fold PLP-dependent enzyme [Clostridia bacterium]
MKQIYLDNAATTYPKPESVRNSVNRALQIFGANPGRGSYEMAENTSMMIYRTREKFAKFFNLSKLENVVFTKSCTEAVNIVAFSKLKPNDHVVISDLEHNCVIRPLHELSKIGVSYSVFETFEDDDETLNSLRQTITDKTKLMICTAASNVFGFKLPISRLCALCHIYGVETCIDAAQLAGIQTIDMDNNSIDYLCVPSHKGLYGIMGCGALLCRNNDLKPIVYGGTGILSKELDMPSDLPEKLESGTANVAGITSISAGLDFVKLVGMNKIANYEMKHIQKIYAELEQISTIDLYSKMPSLSHFSPVLSFNVKGKTPEDVSEFLASKNICVRSGFHCSPLAHKKMKTENGTVRISPSAFTTNAEIDYFVNIIKKYAKI